MNYSRKNTSKRREQIQSNAAMKRKRTGVRLFKSFLIFCLGIGILGLIASGILFKRIIDETPQITADDIKPSAYTTTAYADDGKTEIGTFVSAGSNREYTSLENIPKDLQNAFIAVEDSRFREHEGVDLKGIARAAVTGLTSGEFSQGGSTITQQLIKNSVFPNFSRETRLEKIKRKIQELYLAVQIEKMVDKDEILENYLNTINLGQNTLGVQAASNRYFGKDVSKLTLSECATIAAITKSPTGYNPLTKPEANAKRREKVLDDMLEQGYISQADRDSALADDVYERIQTANTEYKQSITVNSYFVDEVSKAVQKDLCEKLGYTETQAYNAVYSGGLKIITTQNLLMQEICEEELNKDSNYPSNIEWTINCAITITHEDGTQKNYDHYTLERYAKKKYNLKNGRTYSSKEKANKMIEEYIKTLVTSDNDRVDTNISLSPQPQATIVVMDQYTGQVKAMVGGRGEKTTNMSLNRATQSPRQPGSCFKVLSTFVPALDMNDDTLATMIDDAPYKYADGTPVKNHWRGYKGNISIRSCIRDSANVCTVKKYTEITPAVGMQYLTENFKFTTLDATKDLGQAVSLGGVTYGVYNMELTAAYAAIANYGVYTDPVLYTHIYDHDGNLLFENTPVTHTAMKDTTATLITSAMEDVVKYGTGKACRLNNMPVAGKTGTTTSTRDLWFSGYTPYLTASIWSGYDDNQQIEGSSSFHKVIWQKIMQRIHDEMDYKETKFEMPETVVRKTICTATGKLASSDACSKLAEYFAEGTAPTKSCPGHIEEKPETPETQEGTGNNTTENKPAEGTGDNKPQDTTNTPETNTTN